jgi:hypothetical protein
MIFAWLERIVYMSSICYLSDHINEAVDRAHFNLFGSWLSLAKKINTCGVKKSGSTPNTLIRTALA